MFCLQGSRDWRKVLFFLAFLCTRFEGSKKCFSSYQVREIEDKSCPAFICEQCVKQNFHFNVDRAEKALFSDGEVMANKKLKSSLLSSVEPKGVVKSFNFSPSARIQYPTNLNYAICIQRPPTACQVYLSNKVADGRQFRIRIRNSKNS